jgi:hypothetical protein
MKTMYDNGIEKPHWYMTIVDTQGAYRWPKSQYVEIYPVWDGSHAIDVINAYMEVKTGVDYYNVDDREEEIVFKAMKRMLFPSTGPNCLPQPVEPLEKHDIHMDVFRVSGSKNDLKQWARMIAEDLIKEAPDVSGDDTFYDYFPAYIHVFYQVCRELELRALFDQTIEKVKKIVYQECLRDEENWEDDPECIMPKWID